MSQESHDLPRSAVRLSGGIGLAAILLSFFLPWFTVPGESAEAVREGAIVVWLFRGLALLALAFCWRGWRRCEVSLLSLLVALLLFPAVITIWCPNLAGQAAWLQAQHESLTTTTGDLYTTQEDRDSLWRQRVYLVNRPIDSQIIRFPDWGPQNFAWGRGVEICDWLGMAPWFALFARKGWVLALTGSALALLALCAREREAALACALRQVRRGLVLVILLLAVVIAPPLVGSGYLKEAKRSAQRGDHARSLALLVRAGRWFPAIRADGDYVVQKGLLESALNVASPAAQFYASRMLDERGFSLQARAGYLAILERGDSALARECSKALLRQAIDALNSGEHHLASDLLETVVRADPDGLKAVFALQIAQLRQGNVEGVAESGERLMAIYRDLNTPAKKAVLAFAEENRAFAEASRGNTGDALIAWRAARRR